MEICSRVNVFIYAELYTSLTSSKWVFQHPEGNTSNICQELGFLLAGMHYILSLTQWKMSACMSLTVFMQVHLFAFLLLRTGIGFLFQKLKGRSALAFRLRKRAHRSMDFCGKEERDPGAQARSQLMIFFLAHYVNSYSPCMATYKSIYNLCAYQIVYSYLILIWRLPPQTLCGQVFGLACSPFCVLALFLLAIETLIVIIWMNN